MLYFCSKKFSQIILLLIAQYTAVPFYWPTDQVAQITNTNPPTWDLQETILQGAKTGLSYRGATEGGAFFVFKEMHKTYSFQTSTISFTFCARVHRVLFYKAKHKLSAFWDKPKRRYKLTTEQQYSNFVKSYAQVKLAQYSY